MKRIVFTVTNDLNYDQRMMRICGSVASAGYDVVLVGRTKRTSLPLQERPYRQKRLRCWFQKGKLFYAEYNVRLLFYLLFKKMDCICAIDLDTILPCYLASKLKGIKRTYDAHEYFSQLDEVIRRPSIYRFWHWIEKKMLPRLPKGYTVCQGLADEFEKHYGVKYEIIRNVPILVKSDATLKQDRLIFYQGAVNKGRGLDKLVLAMKMVDAPLLVCGDGNFMKELSDVINQNKLEGKVRLTGMLLPEKLREMTKQAYIAVNPFDNYGLNQYLSLPNKFFDYIHAAIPQITMNYPEYQRINSQYQVAVLIDDLDPETIAKGINKLIGDEVLYEKLRKNCIEAMEVLNWQNEEKILIRFYHSVFNG